MTENVAEPLTNCADCGYMKPVTKLRPFGENFTLICADCAFKDEETHQRTMHMIHHLAIEIMEIMGVDNAFDGAVIAIEIPVDVLLGPDENDNTTN